MTEEERRFKAELREVLRGRTALQRDTNAEIVRLLKQALSRIEMTLGAQPTDYQQWSLPQLAREIRQALDAFGDTASASMAAAANSAWQIGQDVVLLPLAAGGVQIVGAWAIDTRQLTAMRTFMTDRIKDIGVAAANKINAELGMVVIGTQTPADAIGKVRHILGEPSRSRATTIVRTELGRVFSVASHESLQEAVPLVPGLQKQWRRSGKRYPRLHHDLADGQIRDVDKPFTLTPLGRPQVRVMYPHDPKAPASETINCGCVSLPYKADWNVAHRGRKPGGIRDLDPGPPIRELIPG